MKYQFPKPICIIPFFLFFLTSILFCYCTHNTPVDISQEITDIENGLLPSIQVAGDTLTQYSMEARMDHYHVPGVSIAVVKDGKMRWARGYGMANTQSGTRVDTSTLFQAGSISKPLAALGALKLVEAGRLDLDADVNNYLKSWKVPDNRFTNQDKVTLRLLLTHSAGMTVHGFPGYAQSDTMPSLVEVLDGKGNTPPIVADTFPGSLWRYSGGGYTVMQQMIEDVSGLPFTSFLDDSILRPLGMHNSTYAQPLIASRHPQASAAYDRSGTLIEGLWHNYPEQAAAGLWTTPADLARYCLAVQGIAGGATGEVLNPGTIRTMLTKHLNDWGLGPALRWDGDSLLFGHGGKNAGFSNNMLASVHQGYGVIVMTNADQGIDLMNEIMRSVSAYYHWGISNPRTVEITKLTDEQLNRLAGSYQLDHQVPDIGDYLVELSIKDGKVIVYDPNNKETNILSPLDEWKFIDVNTGDEVVFAASGKTPGLLQLTWNNQFVFYQTSRMQNSDE
ncbi:MAG: beta-lactamase family protein [Saprospiraceae bacterium]|nr:beta-lactamase family protein [Saprospiraceae bacterium]MCB9317682.1 beta-lactamase family protein [Lewinellaceae bacterium]